MCGAVWLLLGMVAACGGGGGGSAAVDAAPDGDTGSPCVPACPAGQACQPADGGFACVPACPGGQAWEGTRCAPAVLCAGLDCARQGKVCEGEPFAACGRCDSAAGYFDDGRGGCTLVMGACQRQADCPRPGEYCLKLDTDPTRPATCAPPPACVRAQPGPDGPAQAYDPPTSACKACPSCAGVTGSTGNVWPVTAAGNCLCETIDGYYFDDSVDARAPRACDADGDGWVVYPARNALYSNDVALRSNARCAVRQVDGFVLRNERGEERRLTLADLQISDRTLDLFEPLALDAQESFDAASQRLPAYGARRFQPRELNPLTKACVSPQADFNQDGLFDVEQSQTSAPGAGQAWMAPYVKLAYFFELHEGYFRAGAPGEPGRWVIAERRRCDAMAFPLDYGAASASGYWRDCERRRARDFQDGQPGSDFGRFTCQAPTGACPVASASALFDLNMRDPATQIPVHGACTTRPSPAFTGMHHASQFRCVQFQASVSTPYGLDRALLWDAADPTDAGTTWVANLCGIEGAPRTIPGGTGAVDAPLRCTPTGRAQVPVGAVGFALARYLPYGQPTNYTRGCIDEGVEWATLCPGMGVGGSQARGNAFAFGNLYCGCGLHFGGLACEVGCPADQTHYGGALDPGWSELDRMTFACDSGYCVNVICQPGDAGCRPGRRGYWMCGGLSATTGITQPLTGGTYSLRAGGIPLSAFDRSQPLCQNAQNCNQGFRLR